MKNQANRCGECDPCQEWILTPSQAPPCSKRRKPSMVIDGELSAANREDFITRLDLVLMMQPVRINKATYRIRIERVGSYPDPE